MKNECMVHVSVGFEGTERLYRMHKRRQTRTHVSSWMAFPFMRMLHLVDVLVRNESTENIKDILYLLF